VCGPGHRRHDSESRREEAGSVLRRVLARAEAIQVTSRLETRDDIHVIDEIVFEDVLEQPRTMPMDSESSETSTSKAAGTSLLAWPRRKGKVRKMHQ